jgi:restriction system protein
MDESQVPAMSENTAQRMGEFLRVVISFLWDKPTGATTREIMDAIPRSTRLTAGETSPVQAAGFSQYEVTTRSAMTALEKAGWLVREKSRWLLTEAGRLVCKDFRQASDFYVESRRIYENWRLSRPSAQLALEYAREQAWQQIKSYLQALSHYEFRILVRDLLVGMGQSLEWMAPPDKNKGHVDMVAAADPFRVGAGRLLVQIRHTGQVVTTEEVELLVSEIHPDNLLLCISSAGFSRDAVDYASAQTPVRVVLMDLERFVSLWSELYDKLTPEARQRFPLEAVHFLSLEE